MPFDSLGNFTRSYNFQQDRDNGIKILASRVDGEFDNFALGMNSVFFRNGIVALTGDLRMGLNSISGLGNGSNAMPAVRFGNDNGSGMYLANPGQVSISAGGTRALDITNNAVNAVGVLTVAGNPVWHSGNFQPGGYAALTGAVFTGDVHTRAVVAEVSGGGSAALYPAYGNYTGLVSFANSNGVRQGYVGFIPAGGPIQFINDTGNGHHFGGGTVFVDGALTAGQLLVNNQPVWHSGNFQPGSYAPLAGANFSGQVNAPQVNAPIFSATANGTGRNIAIGDDVWLGDINALNTLGIRGQQDFNSGFIQFGTSGARLGNYAGDATLKYADQTVWHGGNFDPNSKQNNLGYTPANRAGDTFSGPVNVFGAIKTYSADAGIMINPRNGDGNNWLVYATDAGVLRFWRSGIGDLMTLDASGNLRVRGNVIANTTL